jgi:putative cell wall-binding protein
MTQAQASHVVLSRDDAFPDSLAGASLSATGPLLFTSPGSLPTGTAQEITRVLPRGGRVYLLGGESAINADVANQVAAMGYDVVRFAGQSRIETALLVADEVRRLYPGNREVLVARAFGLPGNESAGWADSVTGGAFGARQRVPVILTPTDQVHPSVAAWIARDNPSRSLLLGGTAALSDAVLGALPGGQRVAGAERTATAAAIATQLWGARDSGARRFILINGFDATAWAHGLASAGVAADANAPLLMVTPADPFVPTSTAALVSSCVTPQVELLLVGSSSAIPSLTQTALELLDGGGC